jgi:arylsulfatase A-like enzyme
LRSPGPNSGPNLERYLAEITLTERPVSAAELEAVLALYDSTVTSTDARLGRLLDKLDEMGERDSTYLIFTADHGEELFDHNRYFFHGASIYAGTVRIPLIVSGPGLPRGPRSGVPVQNLDIAPTVLDLLGLPVPEDMEGRPLTGLLKGTTNAPPRPHAFVEWQDLIYVVSDGRYAFVDNRWHTWPKKSPFASRRPDAIIAGAPAGFAVACFEAYDLEADPLQQHNLLEGIDAQAVADGSALSPELAALQDALMAWLREPSHERMMNVDTPLEQIEHLKQLGYLGANKDRADVYQADPCLPR